MTHPRFTIACVAVLAACAEPDDADLVPEPTDSVDPSDGTLTTHVPARPGYLGDDPPQVLADGPPQQITIHTGDGPRSIDVVDVGGDLVTEGDIVVVPAERRHLRAYVTYGGRWPATVPFEIDLAMATAERDSVLAAHDHIEERTPIRFVARTAESDFIRYTPTSQGFSSSEVGRQGGRQLIKVQPAAGLKIAAHETLHALGFKHEQKRPDRDSHVEVRDQCIIDGKESQYSVDPDYLELGGYDFASIMHYVSSTFCVKDASDADGDGDLAECACLPMVHTGHACDTPFCVDMDGDGFREFINGGSRLSPLDVNGLYLMYGGGLGTNETDDNLGKAVATGDFDGDGQFDVAVSAPYESPGSDPQAGVVFLYKGTLQGLVPWRWISQETTGLATTGAPTSGLGTNAAGDQYGLALAVGDFDGDGVDDLAVGAPGKDFGSVIDAGAVYLYRGFRAVSSGTDARHGLQPWKLVTQATLGLSSNENFDRFGAAVAVGDLDKDGRRDDLAIGAPGEAVGGSPAGGVVFLATGATTGPVAKAQISGPGPIAAGDRLGAAIALADIDGDGDDDLIAAAPGAARGPVAGAGLAHVYRAAGSTVPLYWITLDSGGLMTAGAGDQFGSAITAGDFDGDGRRDLAISAPQRAGGRVLLFHGRAAATPVAWQLVSQTGLGANESNDEFGFSLATGDLDLDGKDDLVVGTPGEETTSTSDVGSLFVFRGATGGVIAWSLESMGTLATPGLFDRLGSSVAIAPFSHHVPFIVSGAPGRAVEGFLRSGVVLVFQGFPALDPLAVFDQESLAPYHD